MTKSSKQSDSAAIREARLSEALRANLKRRKAQARERNAESSTARAEEGSSTNKES